jgi:membrane fusion protein (multidrug efflux system)
VARPPNSRGRRLPTVGTLKALQGVELSLEVAGTVVELHFESGQKVKAGQLLLQLDSAVETALLETAQADLGLANSTSAAAASWWQPGHLQRRIRPLSAVCKRARPRSISSSSTGEKSIVAPFSGTIGIRQVDVGDYLASGTMIATLQDLSSLYVDFVPEQSVPKIAIGQPVKSLSRPTRPDLPRHDQCDQPETGEQHAQHAGPRDPGQPGRQVAAGHVRQPAGDAA